MLCGAVPLNAKFVAVAAAPFNFQANVSGKPEADAPFAVRLIEPVIPMTEPVAAGDCESQVGGVLRITVQVRVAVVAPLLAVTVKLLFPGFNADDRTSIELAELFKEAPLSSQETAQLASLGVTPKVVEVLPTLLTR